MYEDYFEHIIGSHIDNVDPMSEEMAAGRALDPEYDKKVNEDFKQSMQNIQIIKKQIKLD